MITNLNSKIKKIVIKENFIYYFIVFWAYGFYAIGTDNNSQLKIINLLLPLIVFVFVTLINKKNEDIIELKNLNIFLTVKNNFKYFLFISFFLIYFSYDKLILSISSDEYAYVGLGLIHSNLLIKKLAYYLQEFDEFKIKYLYQLISIFFLISISIYLYLSVNYFNKYKLLNIVIFLTIILTLRVVTSYFEGNTFPHPPLIGLPAFLSISFFGLSDLILKLSYFILFIIFSFYIFLQITKKINKITSLILTLSVFSLPGIIYLGVSYEQALISMICYSIILIEVSKNKIINYKKIFILILFFSCFRILSLISLIIVLLYLIFKTKSLKEFNYELYTAIKNSYPLFLIFPFIFYSFIENSSLTIDRVGFEYLTSNFFFNDLIRMIINSYSFYGGALILFIFLICLVNLKKTKLLFIYTFIILIIYSNVILFNPKYLYEILFPIITYFIVYSNELIKKEFFRNIFLIGMISILTMNIVYLKNFSKLCISNDLPLNEKNVYETKFGCLFHDTYPINLKHAYKYLNTLENFSFKNLYVPGVYYGILPSIINGMKIKEYSQHIEINRDQNNLNIKNNIEWISANPITIHQDERIDYILLGNLSNYKSVENGLIKLGWDIIYSNINIDFKTKTIILYRNN